MVVDAIIRPWVVVVTPSEAGMGGLGMIIIDLMAYLYATNGLVASTQPKKIQRVFDVLTSLFDRISLQTNTVKTVGKVLQPWHALGGMSEELYECQVKGKDTTFRER